MLVKGGVKMKYIIAFEVFLLIISCLTAIISTVVMYKRNERGRFHKKYKKSHIVGLFFLKLIGVLVFVFTTTILLLMLYIVIY